MLLCVINFTTVSALTLPLYVPGAVMGLALVLSFNFTYRPTTPDVGIGLCNDRRHLFRQITLLVVAMKDLPTVFEIAHLPGANLLADLLASCFSTIGSGISACCSLYHCLQRISGHTFCPSNTITTAPLRAKLCVIGGCSPPSYAGSNIAIDLISRSHPLLFRLFGNAYLKDLYDLPAKNLYRAQILHATIHNSQFTAYVTSPSTKRNQTLRFSTIAVDGVPPLDKRF